MHAAGRQSPLVATSAEPRDANSEREWLLEHARALLEPLRAADDVLIQCLAAAKAEIGATGEHRLRRGSSVRDDGGVEAEGRAGDARAEAHRLRRLTKGTEEGPDEGRLPLLRRPRVEVLGGEDAAHADILRLLAPAHEVRRVELFQ